MGSTIFGQFATKFIFRCNEPNLAKFMSDMFGSIEILQQQKSTSYGAHEHRDGISYSEVLIPSNKFMELATLECFVSLPESEIKVANVKLKPVTDVPIINPGFMQLEKNEKTGEVTEENISSIIISDDKVTALEVDNTNEVRSVGERDKEENDKDKENNVKCLGLTQTL